MSYRIVSKCLHSMGYFALKALRHFWCFLLKVSADTSKKKINSLSMELMEARNKLDAKDKVRLCFSFESCHITTRLRERN